LLLKNAVRLLTLLSGIQVTDAHNGLKAYSVEALRKINFHSDSYSFENEILFEIKKHNLTFKEFSSKALYTDYSKSKGQSMFNSTIILEDLIYMLLRR
jgi:polyprenyl-phospho-N-acetylgalactosaminyl synthase